jgi:hypothetical protein
MGEPPFAPTTLSHAEIVRGAPPFAPTTLSHAEIVRGAPPFAPTPPILRARGWG